MLSISAMDSLSCTIPHDLVGRLRKCSNELQMLPEAATRALEILRQPDCSIRQLTQIIETDVGLTSNILKTANSPFCSTGRPIASLHEAVIQIGFKRCYNLIQATCAKSLMQRLSQDQSSQTRGILVHSLASALAATELTRLLSIEFQGSEFTAAILHNIGRQLLFLMSPDEYDSLQNMSETDWDTQKEVDAVGTDHCIVGAMFAGFNSLPMEVCEAIRFHHAPEKAIENPMLTYVIAAATALATHQIETDEDTAYEPQSNQGLQLLFSNHDTQLSDKDCSDQILSRLSKLNTSKSG